MRMAIVTLGGALLLSSFGPLGCPGDEDEELEAAAEAPAPAAEASPGENPGQGGDVGAPDEVVSGGDGDIEQAVALRADPKASKVGFAVARATIGHIGSFEDFSAALTLDEKGEPMAFAVRVKTGSVVADQPGLTHHLKSADFFDAEKFPEAGFEATAITPVADTPGHYTVTGPMRLHGVTQELSFEATLEREAELIRASASVDISAKAFGITYAGMEAELADDAVALEIDLSFPRPE